MTLKTLNNPPSLALPVALLGGLLLASCAPRTIYIPAGEPVQLAAPVPGHPVWVVTPGGRREKTRLTIPEGWWAIEDTRP